MIETKEELLNRLESGALVEHRDENLELKSTWKADYGKKLSALGNNSTSPVSWFVVGVADDGTVIGKSEKWAKQTEETLSQIINSRLDPVQACCHIWCEETSKGWIVAVPIKSPGEVVYWNDSAYAGSGTTVKEMEPHEVLALRLTLPGLTDFTRQPCESSYHSAILKEYCDRVLERGSSCECTLADLDQPSVVLEKLGMQNTHAARILFGDCVCRVVSFDADGEVVETSTVNGLFSLLSDSFLSDIQVSNGGTRIPRPGTVPVRALREGIANAIAHAAYFEQDGDLIIERYPDRISISNLCVQESSYFANRWFSRSHKTVNGLLMEVLRIAGAVDELGRGKHLIFSEIIKIGLRPPEVFIERAGRYHRWKLILHGGSADQNLLRVLDRSREHYGNDQKALISQALILWRRSSVSDIRQFIDGDFYRQFAEVLSELGGPIFYLEKNDQITLTRWASILIDEGKDSKALSPEEEDRMKEYCRDFCSKFHGGFITPARLRELAVMGNTKSEQVLSSKILTQWATEGLVDKVSRGKYRFPVQTATVSGSFQQLLRALMDEDDET